MGPPAFYTKVLNYMKVGQHYYSTLYKGQEPLELLMVKNLRIKSKFWDFTVHPVLDQF